MSENSNSTVKQKSTTFNWKRRYHSWLRNNFGWWGCAQFVSQWSIAVSVHVDIISVGSSGSHRYRFLIRLAVCLFSANISVIQITWSENLNRFVITRKWRSPLHRELTRLYFELLQTIFRWAGCRSIPTLGRLVIENDGRQLVLPCADEIHWETAVTFLNFSVSVDNSTGWNFCNKSSDFASTARDFQTADDSHP